MHPRFNRFSHHSISRHIRRLRRFGFASLVAFFSMMLGCTLSSLSTPTPIPTATPVPASDWDVLAPGLERRTYNPPNNGFGSLVALRIDPNLYTLRAHYQPGASLTLDQWRTALPGAVAFVNGNFFDPQQVALGMVIADGAVYGQSYTDRGGMVQVQNGVPRVRSLLSEPYLGEALEHAVQAFPMLVTGGQTSFNNTIGDRSSRRTVAAQDAQGRIILLATPLLGLSLTDLAAYLPTTDMGIVNAVNLDGGGSTMMSIGAGLAPYTLDSFDPVPVVLAVYPR
ncbi:MAG: phosphodiester glycosidase family protein [Anaerolineae bacterium]|nr:phosphodiester glycosidase family protein [Anaerolineae bacterium]